MSNKHGFNREVVFVSSDEQAAMNHEVWLIAELHTCVYDPNYNGIGTNYTFGGDGVSGYKHTKQANQRNALVHTGLVQSPEACEKKRISMKASSHVKRVAVEQLDLNGNIVAVHPSVTSAALSLKKPAQAATLVSRCCRGKVATFAGFRWRYVPGARFEVSSQRSQARVRAVVQVTQSGEIVAEHRSIAAASRAMGRNPVSIRGCCHGQRETAYGFKWQFIDAQD